MITEYEVEPIPGLPGRLPRGERILWQGAPRRATLARTAFHTRHIALYFGGLATVALVSAAINGGSLVGVGMTLLLGALGVGLLEGLALLAARSTIYTLTNRRLVMRIGIALPKCINLPLGVIGAVDMKLNRDGTADLPMTVVARQEMGYLSLWPHARPWRVAEPQPMLRAVPDGAKVAALIVKTCQAAQAAGNVVQLDAARSGTAPDAAVAA
ncbi:photosynthetic complex putative assembly protein PuhB [Sphingomonas sp. RT2P30]|uniref:photosynthetic complex putative assembly protein PuhB n=1 Tax=Parasphingomonas halimpatiens TaxID=3096162 RepID=UPI002FCBC2E2